MKPENLYTPNVLDKMTERDRYSYQARRYGISVLTIMSLPSGKAIIIDHLRDPIAVVDNFSDLITILEGFNDYESRRWYAVQEKKLAAYRRRQETLTEEDSDELDEIKIDL